jgi:hypothetical protein
MQTFSEDKPTTGPAKEGLNIALSRKSQLSFGGDIFCRGWVAFCVSLRLELSYHGTTIAARSR